VLSWYRWVNARAVSFSDAASPVAFVARDSGPVECFRRRIGMRELLHDFSESPLRVCPPLLLERHMRQAERQLREEIIGGRNPSTR